MRLSVLALCLALTACVPADSRTQAFSAEETRLISFLTRDHFVVIEHSERNSDGHLLLVTRQGRTTQRYIIAPDDPANPVLRLRRLDDACTLNTAPNNHPGGGPIDR